MCFMVDNEELHLHMSMCKNHETHSEEWQSVLGD